MKQGIMMRLIVLILCNQMLFMSCSNSVRTRVNKENYNRLKIGMSYEQVITILGPENTCDNAAGDRSCIWGDEKKNIGVQFVGGKVVFLTSRGL